ncbi:MAG TPA: hypothetical protein PLS53_07930 [Thermoanaerobaculaceae bacterium]|nr:hypothetical protein [Thermoanaerobaculaceae bacterium]HPS78066.1 hypothetical protein [Thermoanaerobaculaceae bacterium]
MNAAEFIAKWRRAALGERQAAQQHFLDLCELLRHPKPAEADPVGESFCFERGAARLMVRTLTNLYNQRPAWLALAHQKLDAAVFAAYGWDPAMSDDALLERLLALNLDRAGGN